MHGISFESRLVKIPPLDLENRFSKFFNVFSLFRFNIREGHCQSLEQTYITLTKIVLIKLANRFRYDIASFLETDVRTDRQTDRRQTTSSQRSPLELSSQVS